MKSMFIIIIMFTLRKKLRDKNPAFLIKFLPFSTLLTSMAPGRFLYAFHTSANSFFLSFQFSRENKQEMSVCTRPRRFEAGTRASAPFR